MATITQFPPRSTFDHDPADYYLVKWEIHHMTHTTIVYKVVEWTPLQASTFYRSMDAKDEVSYTVDGQASTTWYRYADDMGHRCKVTIAGPASPRGYRLMSVPYAVDAGFMVRDEYKSPQEVAILSDIKEVESYITNYANTHHHQVCHLTWNIRAGGRLVVRVRTADDVPVDMFDAVRL